MIIFEQFGLAMKSHRERGDKGAAMAEYALLLSGIAAVVALAVENFGGRLLTMFNSFFP